MSLLSNVSAWSYRLAFLTMAGRQPCSPTPLNLSSKPRILAFTCAGIGDTLTDSVVFRALKETWPKSVIAAVVHRRRKFLTLHNRYIDHIYPFQKGYLAFWNLHRQLQTEGPWDVILQLRGNDPEPRCLSWLLNANATVSTPNMTRLSDLCGHQVLQPDWDDTHGVEQTLRLARYVGADTQNPHLVYQVRSEEVVALERKLAELWAGLDFDLHRPRLVFQIGGGRRAAWRDWPAEHYAELIRDLAQDIPAEFFLLAGPEKILKQKALQIEGLVRSKALIRIRNAVGRLNLAESAALLASCRTLVSTDTGIMHLGFAVGTRVVALIHHKNPANRVGPYGYGKRHIVHQLSPGPANQPAVNMASISPFEVAQSVRAIWRQEQP